MLQVQETGVRGREKCLLTEHIALTAILKLDKYIKSDARTSMLLLSQERMLGMKMQKMHQAVDHPQYCLRKSLKLHLLYVSSLVLTSKDSTVFFVLC
jgi:hypothetical protein